MFKAVLLASAVAMCTAQPTKNIVELAESVPTLSTLVAAVKAGGLVDTLSGPGPFTVFAPTNAAFDELPRGVLEELLKPENKATLVKVLTYHVVSGKVMAKDLTNEQKVTTVEGSNVTVHLLRDSRGVRVMIQDLVPNSRWADVIQADVEASNGVVHVVDRVLIPGKLMDTIKALAPRAPNIVELAASVPELSTLVAAVKAAGLVDTLSGPGPFTVFAPTNAAFQELPPHVLEDLLKPENKATLVKLLTYHVVSGSVHAKDLKNDERVKTVEGDNVTVHVFTRAGDTRVLIEDREPNARWANVIKADVDASNGVVHIIDRVLIPGRLTPTPPNPSGNQTIVQLAVATPTLSTLVAAVKAAGLVDTLSGPGPFTVFAPTNDAFDRLPAGALKYLLDPANKAELVKVLTFHVVAGNVQSNEVREGEVITTVEGGHLLAHVRDYQGERHIFLQDDVASRHFAEVIKADVEASNGVVHVIDSVLIPPRQLEQMKLN